ncbi:uncharacterized protein A4U43_C02F3430, partial [Asparagus officinalis]
TSVVSGDLNKMAGKDAMAVQATQQELYSGLQNNESQITQISGEIKGEKVVHAVHVSEIPAGKTSVGQSSEKFSLPSLARHSQDKFVGVSISSQPIKSRLIMQKPGLRVLGNSFDFLKDMDGNPSTVDMGGFASL